MYIVPNFDLTGPHGGHFDLYLVLTTIDALRLWDTGPKLELLDPSFSSIHLTTYLLRSPIDAGRLLALRDVLFRACQRTTACQFVLLGAKVRWHARPARQTANEACH